MSAQSTEGAMPPLPEPIGMIAGRRLKSDGTRDFFGYFNDDYKPDKKIRVIDEDQLKAYAAPLLARVAELQAALTRLSEQCDRLRLPGCPMSDAEKFAKEVLLNQGAS